MYLVSRVDSAGSMRIDPKVEEKAIRILRKREVRELVDNICFYTYKYSFVGLRG